MIQSAKDFIEYRSLDGNLLYKPQTLKQKIISFFCKEPEYVLRKYLYFLRKEELYINTAKNCKLKSILGLYYDRKKNRLGNRIGVEIGPNCFGKGLTIYHIGSVIVNPEVRVGENCKLHGANCIGNDGKSQGVPHIGDNVDIGYGAAVIGDIVIADDVVIGANAVVNKSVLTPGCIVAGVPAKIVKEQDN